MKKQYIIGSLALSLMLSGCQGQNTARWGQVIGQVAGMGTPSGAEIAQGLKQALELGTSQGADRLSKTDGFFANAAVKILFPPEAQKVEKAIRGLGLNSLADNVILSLNRAAEDAAAQAKPIFVAAIKQMTLQDATEILFGQPDAATNYFKRVTSAQLMEKFRPVIASSLNKVGATRYWSEAISQYNTLPLVSKIDPDLSQYVAQQAMEGMFKEIALEELKIRENFGARSTPLLQKVFGYAERSRESQ